MRLFRLERVEDVSGTSGVGHVADGCEFPDGVCVLRWKSVPFSSTAIYNSLAELEHIHGHGGKTRVVFVCKREV